ncbi:helix-turn-helix domain-containing protein [Mucilaginibacter sp.]
MLKQRILRAYMRCLVCVYASQTGKKVPVSYPANPGTIGEHLKRKRMDSKLLQKDVAKILGVPEDCITNWEKSRSIPQIQFLPLIIQFLGYLPFSFDQTTLSGKLKAYRHLKWIRKKSCEEYCVLTGPPLATGNKGKVSLISEPCKR